MADALEGPCGYKDAFLNWRRGAYLFSVEGGPMARVTCAGTRVKQRVADEFARMRE